jgi:MoaA/NifB/PqqE/SkfB family radical SAM enzyme
MNDGSVGFVDEDASGKIFRHPDYKYSFSKKSGLFMRWGATTEDDGVEALGLPEIADIEISTICNGPKGTPCKFCYKSNSGQGENMSLALFREVFDRLPPTVTQIAFGIGDIDSNPDMAAIFRYAKDRGVIPNVTINGGRMTPEWFDFLAETCGAVAVSLYDSDLTYDAVKELTDRGMTQVNIHFMLAEETGNKFMEHLAAVRDDERLKKLNATVILGLKKKGRGGAFNTINPDFFHSLVQLMIKEGVRFGFDSCSAGKVQKSVRKMWDDLEIDLGTYQNLKMMIEPCESTVYSSYINERGEFFPCSFMEGEKGWRNGIPVYDTVDFLEEVWMDLRTRAFRKRVIDCRQNCGGCVHYEV